MKVIIKVKNLNDGMEFPSLNAAARHYGTRVQTFSMLYRGKFKSFKGNKFEFKRVRKKTIKVCCVETGEIFDSCYLASKHFNTNPSKFYQMYKKNKNEYQNHHFEFIKT